MDGLPASDGFNVSTSTVSPGGIPISQSPLKANLDLGCVGSTLSSLNILDAQRTHDFTGLTRFGFNLWQSTPDNVRLDMDFTSMRIQAMPEPGTYALTLAGPALVVVFAGRRQRT